MSRRLLAMTAALVTLTALAGCADEEAKRADAKLKAPIPRALEESRTEDGLLVRPFDTNGDGEADVVKYFAEKPDPDDPSRLVRSLKRLEMDLNYDGIINVRRTYDQLGKLDTESVDTDLDGRFDSTSHYDGGELTRKQILDPSTGSVVETRYYAGLELIRVERDTTGDSKVDYWEYYDQGILERIGRDFNADGRADSWQKR